jgi:hypothetical protein
VLKSADPGVLARHRVRRSASKSLREGWGVWMVTPSPRARGCLLSQPTAARARKRTDAAGVQEGHAPQDQALVCPRRAG